MNISYFRSWIERYVFRKIYNTRYPLWEKYRSILQSVAFEFFFARSLKEPFVYVQEFLTKFPTEWMTCHSKIKHVTRAKIHMRILKGIENRSEWWSRKGLLLYIFVGINWSWNVENISPWLRPPKSLFSNRLIDTKISKGNSFHEFNPFQVCELKFVLC